MTKLILALLVGVFLGAFVVELFGQSRLKLIARRVEDIWRRTKASARSFREEFGTAYSGGAA